MRRIRTSVVTLSLLAAPWVHAQAPATKAVRAQVDELGRAYQKEMQGLEQQFKVAESREAKDKLRDKAFKEVGPNYIKQMMAIATAHPKDPAAADALVFVCAAPPAGRSPLVPDAVKQLLRDHAGSDQLAVVCQAVVGREDNEKLIRSIREGATNKTVKLQAGFYLAEVFREKEEATAAQTREAEKLYDEFVTAAKDVKDIPPEMIKDAEGGLKDLRVFAVGKTAPATEGKDLAGKKVSLADYKGKVVVFDFWATWCGPCVAMIPHERELTKKYADRPFTLVSVSADEKAADVTEFHKETPMPWAHWFGGGENGVASAWNIRAFPTIFVIDAKGVIRGKILGGGPNAEKKLDELVATLMKEVG